ncbi:MAG TPA: Clp protease N-terminal domain-containing protein [Dermatophilaceae bacterium]
MFERFTEGSRAVVAAARELAVELGSRDITVGHLLYGCAKGQEATAGEPLNDCGITAASIRALLPRGVEQQEGQADPEALRAIGIDYEGVRAAVEETFGSGALDAAPDRRVRTGGRRAPRFTPEAKRSLELALQVARELHHDRMAPGHLLLGLLRLDYELASRVLEQSGTTVAELSATVLAGMSTSARPTAR